MSEDDSLRRLLQELEDTDVRVRIQNPDATSVSVDVEIVGLPDQILAARHSDEGLAWIQQRLTELVCGPEIQRVRRSRPTSIVGNRAARIGAIIGCIVRTGETHDGRDLSTLVDVGELTPEEKRWIEDVVPLARELRF